MKRLTIPAILTALLSIFAADVQAQLVNPEWSFAQHSYEWSAQCHVEQRARDRSIRRKA